MRRLLAPVTLLLAALACSSGDDASTAVPPTFRGFWNRPHGTIAITLLFEPDAGARLWQVQCDSFVSGTAGRWIELTDGGLQLLDWSGQPAFRAGDDAGTLVATPPLFRLSPAPDEVWSAGAVCSVCPMSGPVEVVPCADPDGGA